MNFTSEQLKSLKKLIEIKERKIEINKKLIKDIESNGLPESSKSIVAFSGQHSNTDFYSKELNAIERLELEIEEDLNFINLYSQDL